MSERLDHRELSGVRWLLGQLLVLLSLFGTYTIDLGSSTLVTLAIFAVLLATAFPVVVESIPGLLWKIAPGFLLAAIVSDFVLSRGDVLPPLFRMIVLLTLYRALQARSPREDMQVLLLSLFLILVTGVLSLEISFGLQMLIYAPTAMGLLFVANLSSGRKLAREEAGEPSQEGALYRSGWLRLIRRIRLRVDRRTLVAGGLLYLLTTALALLLFILMPRFDIGAALPFPRLQTTDSLTGFTDHVRYGDVVSILDDDSIAMRVDVETADAPARPYWRMVVLDAYYDGGFMVSPKVARERRTLTNYRFDFDNFGNSGNNRSVWTLYLEGGISAYLPAGDTFDALLFKNRVDLQFHDLTRVLKTNETNATTLSLRYEGLEFNGVIPMGTDDPPLIGMDPLLLNTNEPDYLQDVSYPQTLLVAPGGTEDRRIMDEVLRELGPPGSLAVEEFADQLVDRLREARGYSLQTTIPGGEADRVLRWVESGEAGHCELYAGAFVLICRYAGIPARLVTGYAGGDWNGYENYFMVRNRHAHAWCEILDPGRGWVRVDPTPGYGVDPGSVDSALAGGRLRLDRTWQAWLDSLRVVWYRRVIQFDSADQEVMTDAVKGIGARGADWLRQSFSRWKSVLQKDWKSLVDEGNWKQLTGDLLYPLLVVFSGFVAIYLLRRMRGREKRERLIRRRAGNLISRFEDRLSAGHAVSRELHLIRYGPVSSWPHDPLRSLRRLKREGRRSRADG